MEEYGPVTRRPFVDTLEGSAHPNMKELRPRPTKGGAHIRVLFASTSSPERSCSSPETKQGTGRSGTRRTFSSPTAYSPNTNRR
ncbi:MULTISPECIES: hypothetical protein [unclassified Mycobacterium]|uniref:hypothetical protein n=1 Tax=unclassified Mycobacterium TaxID=2642494 RepID=UPI001E2B2349|nr:MULTISPECIES: hypothetical protein [unclassified Mycobacterium]